MPREGQVWQTPKGNVLLIVESWGALHWTVVLGQASGDRWYTVGSDVYIAEEWCQHHPDLQLS
jgi:hypothetical protein